MPALEALVIAEPTVGKKSNRPASQPAKDADKDKQINFRANPRLSSRLEDTAEALGLDVSNLVRMILNENLPAYEDRAARLRAGGSD